MTKLLATCAALSVAALLALADSAGATTQRPDGYRTNDQIEVSSARRHRRVYHRRYVRHRYYAPYYGYHPYYRPYYRPYYPAPWPLPFFGPFWF